ncbi:MAG: cupin domain-containing protein [Myxococcota bacterium]
MQKQDWIRALNMTEHVEGGYFCESYRARQQMDTDREGCQRAVMTSIYYMLTDDRPVDHLHLNRSNILHYFQAGSPITYLLLDPQKGILQRVTLGLDFTAGQVPQLCVPGGIWKAAVLEQGTYGLLGEAVAPGFDYRDMNVAGSAWVQEMFPQHWDALQHVVRVK